MILILFFTLLMMCVISLSVFGSGQVFIPLFRWFWIFLEKTFNANISNDTINEVISISNLTPGLVSTKFAFFSGYLISNGYWYGYLAAILIYVVFALCAIMVLVFVMKNLKKFESSKTIQRIFVILKPVIAGIIFSLAIQLFISITFPFVTFNSSISSYFKIDFGKTNAIFFSGWRRYVLFAFVPVSISFSIIMLKKTKIHLLVLILLNIALALLFFQPWI
ncbi:chromate transporter [Mycoplasmopsis synoviae]|uniref:chromate transporter n=2 Tax=Mycoplasmopsis synoviae TaxID=2109 RepID=UPI000CA2AF5C|nr:chromate transporter [Mycoplasmopsis synoviae]AKJ21119.1 Chromate transport protein [Mycoplasmopsis synoviae]AQU48462.1 Chromate transport protein [Mycoplasmopsis synoviae]AWL84018.1 chromate transporter [Mycoplasmopsis synoviae]QLE13750.1 chromate transporter [Mycoplasmopsis synoviae]UZF64509.1 chromate transporter [Mycoplasmopsis synoviae]